MTCKVNVWVLQKQCGGRMLSWWQTWACLPCCRTLGQASSTPSPWLPSWCCNSQLCLGRFVCLFSNQHEHVLGPTAACLWAIFIIFQKPLGVHLMKPPSLTDEGVTVFSLGCHFSPSEALWSFQQTNRQSWDWTRTDTQRSLWCTATAPTCHNPRARDEIHSSCWMFPELLHSFYFFLLFLVLRLCSFPQ